jgi:hypothetical protein
MARIVEDVPRVEKQVVCREGCGRTVAYVPNDVTVKQGPDYGGGWWTQESLTCPGCQKTIVLRTT